MTPQEHTEYQNKMRSMKTQQERDAYRLQHHKQMQERARERGQELPDSPPAKGGGMDLGGGRSRGQKLMLDFRPFVTHEQSAE